MNKEKYLGTKLSQDFSGSHLGVFQIYHDSLAKVVNADDFSVLERLTERQLHQDHATPNLSRYKASPRSLQSMVEGMLDIIKTPQLTRKFCRVSVCFVHPSSVVASEVVLNQI